MAASHSVVHAMVPLARWVGDGFCGAIAGAQQPWACAVVAVHVETSDD